MAVTAAATAACLAPMASAGSPYGVWRRPAGQHVVKVFRCGGGLGVKIMKSKANTNIGKVFMCGAKARGNGTFSGRLRDPDDNSVYSGQARLISVRRMHVSGCIQNTSICRTEVWRRVK
jgi:uncharacterized protein (DUF2147 family)